MKLILLYGLVMAFNVIAALAESNQGDLMTRTTYCACKCCEPNKDRCFRHPSIPASFKCSESNCNEKFCTAWDRAKCAKSCFCEQCQGELEKDDYRCVSHKGVPDSCDCSKTTHDCKHLQLDAKEMNEATRAMKPFAEKMHCVLPCFCKTCKDKLPPEMYGDCMMSEQPEEGCPCEKLSCPSDKVLDDLKKLKEIRAEREKGESSPYQFGDEIDKMMSPQKAKKVKCRMQCYCDVCGQSSEKIHDNCEKMLPKPRVEGCNCNKEDISCPSEDVDQMCKLYCFCKGCMNDPRMTKPFIESCKMMIEKDQDCFCADEEDCSVLDKVNKSDKGEKKAEKKKGKLKKKKPDRDEL